MTVSIRCQLQLCYVKEFAYNVSNIILGKIINNCDLEIQNFFPSIEHSPIYKSVQINGKIFLKDSIVVTEITDDGPSFGRIEKIYAIFESVYFLIFKINVIYFKKHFYAYKVNIEKEKAMFDVKSLPKIDPCILVRKSEDNYIII